MIRIDALWLATAPLDMRAGPDKALGLVVEVFGAARLHHAYLFANQRGTRMKVLVHDGQGLWLLARRLYGNAVALLTLTAAALYLPLFHYAGLHLAENPFTALLVWAWVLLARALDAATPRATLSPTSVLEAAIPLVGVVVADAVPSCTPRK